MRALSLTVPQRVQRSDDLATPPNTTCEQRLAIPQRALRLDGPTTPTNTICERKNLRCPKRRGGQTTSRPLQTPYVSAKTRYAPKGVEVRRPYDPYKHHMQSQGLAVPQRAWRSDNPVTPPNTICEHKNSRCPKGHVVGRQPRDSSKDLK